MSPLLNRYEQFATGGIRYVTLVHASNDEPLVIQAGVGPLIGCISSSRRTSLGNIGQESQLFVIQKDGVADSNLVAITSIANLLVIPTMNPHETASGDRTLVKRDVDTGSTVHGHPSKWHLKMQKPKPCDDHSLTNICQASCATYGRVITSTKLCLPEDAPSQQYCISSHLISSSLLLYETCSVLPCSVLPPHQVVARQSYHSLVPSSVPRPPQYFFSMGTCRDVDRVPGKTDLGETSSLLK
ncbi:hypothetical protein ACRALDRAFT_206052 [Sodiomyces alcalophilus JCM 7366]|uniref:uncharacterized protein n=1 Tax=Sodiomyces alcalophilus JCM 7366 TaxID=591952 RepID=UPI0039B6CB09